jgi:hypothetical protein
MVLILLNQMEAYTKFVHTNVMDSTQCRYICNIVSDGNCVELIGAFLQKINTNMYL